MSSTPRAWMRRTMTVAATLLVSLVGLPAAGAQVTAVDSIGVTVADMDRSLPFYRDVLGFQPVSDLEVSGDEWERLQGVFGLRMRIVRLRLGDEALELIQYLAPRGRPLPADSRSNDRWFQHVAIVVKDMDRAYRRLRDHGVAHASPAPQRLPDWNPVAGGIRAFYFKDPDGHPLEILQFPAGKGDSKWRKATEALFLGIDHTAIVVAHTEESIAFYRERLGLHVSGTSENYGSEQERLNNVFGARLHITTLRAPTGPGIELLEYLAPSGGRPFPVDAQANDLVHWQVRALVENADSLVSRLTSGRSHLVSPGVITLPRAPLGFGKGLLVRDPDGHAVQVVER
jgi:catechol 2,3-dioxygenase-like lactoylglutathione lyase family enzyme